jgi:glutamate-1-semialdehyde 2,1-aminomutase
MFEHAAQVSPGGVHHNLRRTLPLPLFIARGEGAWKWDVDGNKYLCYAVGQGSQILGYNHPAVVAAIARHAGTGVPGASHELEIEWASLVRELLPSAEKTRFLASGTEAVMLAFRLARAWTERTKILRFEGHYHGWHDYGMIGYRPPFARSFSAGVPDQVSDTMVTVSTRAPREEIERLLAAGDIAAVILEPTGASWGTIPLDNTFCRFLRQATAATGTLLVFDEMITGFRVAPGGVQAKEGIVPDLTTLGKILTGGMHGGGLAGRADVMDLLEPGGPTERPYVLHHGTFNGHPLTAAAGIATLNESRSGEIQAAADHHVGELIGLISDALEELSISGFAYGHSSMFHVYLDGPETALGARQSADQLTPVELLSMKPQLIAALTTELRARGVDLFSYNGGMASSAHGGAELDWAEKAFRGAFEALRDSGTVAS